MYFAVSVGMLGYTRIQSVVCYNSATRTFDELTPAIAKHGIKTGQVKGVLWQDNGDEDENGGMFIPDKEGFNKQNIMVKTAAAKFRPLLGDLPGVPVNSMYNVVRVLHTNYRGTLYEIVSNRYDRIKVTESQLRELNNISPVAGVWFTENEIKIADGIKIEDRTGKDNKVEHVENPENGLSESTEPVTDTAKVEVESTENTNTITMEEIFKEAGTIKVTDDMKEQAYNVESGIGSEVPKQTGSKTSARGKKKK